MVKQSNSALKGKKWIDLGTLAMALLGIVLINYVGAYVFERFDLTSEKRYTLSDATIDNLENLEDIVFVRVYLEGNLPTEFRELRDATKEMLDELKAYAGLNLEYEFINPSASPIEEERIEVYKELTRQGLQYSNIRMRAGDKLSEQIIFPGAVLTFNGKETPIQLLKGRKGSSQQEMIASSIQQLEYEFMSAIKKLSNEEMKRVAFIEGHGELDKLATADAENALSEFYTVERITIDEKIHALDGLDAIIIARPDSAYSEKDKFIIDQFVMNGGKVLWCIDPVFARMDSLKQSQFTMGLVLEHNLTDQLFKYGVRLNNDLIMDLEALPIPIVTGMVGNQPNYEMFSWYYMPLLMGNQDHPISKNLERIKGEFSSSLEPLDVEGITATPLLSSSEKSRVVNAPVRISFNILREKPRYEMYSTGPHHTGMLLEGSFESVFKNRLPKKIIEDDGISFKEQSAETKMIVLSDGNILANEVNRKDEVYYALGFYKYTEEVYGNKEFLMNAMNYLLDDSGLLNIRSKEFKIRLLDQAKIDSERFYWQGLNAALPILLILLFGAGRMYLRKRTYVR
jgi:ABC-2 type transport system permease protein